MNITYPYQGKLVTLTEGDYSKLQAGEYAKYRHFWVCRAPNGLLGSLVHHNCTEEADGSLTVSPSIRINGGDSEWHGFLQKGIWTLP